MSEGDETMGDDRTRRRARANGGAPGERADREAGAADGDDLDPGCAAGDIEVDRGGDDGDRGVGGHDGNGGVGRQDGDGPGGGGPGEEPRGTDVHERARQGVEHLQAAARELIAAARAALDVAEEVVNDPDAVGSLAGVVAGLSEMARRVAGGSWPASGARELAPEDERPAKVERIRVT